MVSDLVQDFPMANYTSIFSAWALLDLLILLSLGPVLFNKLTNFLKQEIDQIQSKPIQVHYQHLSLADL